MHRAGGNADISQAMSNILFFQLGAFLIYMHLPITGNENVVTSQIAFHILTVIKIIMEKNSRLFKIRSRVVE